VEPIIAFVMFGVIFVVTQLYLRFVHKGASPHPEFERWVATRPLVGALRVRRGTEIDAVYAVRNLLGKREFFNPGGGYPWQHYIVTFESRQVAEGVVGLFATHSQLARDTAERPDFQTVLSGLGREVKSLEELWLHGWMRSPAPGHAVDRQRMSWCGDVGDDGALDVTAMIGQPPWTDRRAA
jgi:hypothetical protein